LKLALVFVAAALGGHNRFFEWVINMREHGGLKVQDGSKSTGLSQRGGLCQHGWLLLSRSQRIDVAADEPCERRRHVGERDRSDLQRRVVKNGCGPHFVHAHILGECDACSGQ